MITFEEFLEKIKAENINVTDTLYLSYKKEVKGPLIYIEWITGGMSGGSCWGDEASPIETESEPKFEALDKILTIVCPNISYLGYRKVESSLIQKGTSYESGYYGNNREYDNKYIILKDLYDFFVNEKII